MTARANEPVIVGASAAGLFTACRLAQAGVEVRLYEARSELDYDERTLIMTPAWLRLLDFDPAPAVLTRTHTFELISRGASATIRLDEPDVVLERARLMQLLLAQAHDAGVEVVTGHRFQGIARPAPIPLLCFENGRGPRHEEASTIIGADGVNSRVAESMERNGIERVSIVQARVELPADLPSGTVRIWFDRGLTRFFIWLIPESGGTGAAGLVAETEAAAEAALDRFLSAENLEPMAYQKAWVPLYSPGQRPSRSLGRGRAILVGDAASQVKVTTVGGMMTGMRGAQAAARSLLRGTSYASEMAPLRRELEAHALVRRVLDQFTDDDYDRLLRRLDQRGRQVLGRFSRDELTRSLWRLLLAQPGWLTLGARALLRGLTRNLKHS